MKEREVTKLLNSITEEEILDNAELAALLLELFEIEERLSDRQREAVLSSVRTSTGQHKPRQRKEAPRKRVSYAATTEAGNTYIVHAYTPSPVVSRKQLAEETLCTVQDVPTTHSLAYCAETYTGVAS